ncbi:MAG: PAS domain-containing protein, partial [Planctomycetia bacterium]
FCAYLKDADGRFLFMNRHLRATYPEVVAGHTVHDSFASEQADDFTRNDDWVRRTGEPVTCEEIALGTDGVERHWSSFKLPVVDGQGRRGVGGVSIEITDRKRADAQATRSESLLRRLIEVQEREKRSLCHEFHDGLMQYAIGARMMLDAWRHEHPDADADAVDEAMRTIDAGIADGRRTIRGIRPETLDDLGLKAAVEEYAVSLAGPGLDVEVEVAAEVDDVPPTVQTTAFRIVQEACANARRHSGTARLGVDVRVDGDTLAIRVEDFGRGFDAASPPRTGFGVVGMAERARLAGGECHVESVPDRGTVVTARLPTREP